MDTKEQEVHPARAIRHQGTRGEGRDTTPITATANEERSREDGSGRLTAPVPALTQKQQIPSSDILEQHEAARRAWDLPLGCCWECAMGADGVQAGCVLDIFDGEHIYEVMHPQ